MSYVLTFLGGVLTFPAALYLLSLCTEKPSATEERFWRDYANRGRDRKLARRA